MRRTPDDATTCYVKAFLNEEETKALVELRQKMQKTRALSNSDVARRALLIANERWDDGPVDATKLRRAGPNAVVRWLQKNGWDSLISRNAMYVSQLPWPKDIQRPKRKPRGSFTDGKSWVQWDESDSDRVRIILEREGLLVTPMDVHDAILVIAGSKGPDVTDDE